MAFREVSRPVGIDEDLLVANNDYAPWLLRNEASGAAWIGWHPIRRFGADACGARVTPFADGSRRVVEIRPGRSFLSMHDGRLFFGLDRGRSRAERVEVRWSSGEVDAFVGVEGCPDYVVIEGLDSEE